VFARLGKTSIYSARRQFSFGRGRKRVATERRMEKITIRFSKWSSFESPGLYIPRQMGDRRGNIIEVQEKPLA